MPKDSLISKPFGNPIDSNRPGTALVVAVALANKTARIA